MYNVWEGKEIILHTTMLYQQNVKEGDCFDSVDVGERISS
jgi:hypothetical protein